jgi:rabenosyn-5
LGTQDDPPPHPKQLQLQNTIRSSITQFLRQTMLGLPTLPTAEELKKLQEQRRLEIEKRIQQEKQIALDEQIRYNSSPQRRTANYNNNYSVANNESAVVSPDAGWGPEYMRKRADNSDQIEDPMLQQINIIRNYIKQAREAHKYDEMHMLEENLKELEIEYFIQEHANKVSS